MEAPSLSFGAPWSVTLLVSLFLCTALFFAFLLYLSRRRGKEYVAKPLVTSLSDDMILKDAELQKKQAEKSCENLHSFLENIRLFGITSEPSFFQLVDKVETIKIKPRELLKDLDEAYYIVVEGKLELYAEGEVKEENMIHQATPRTSVFSLYSLLYVLCDIPPIPSNVVASTKQGAEVVRIPFEAFKNLEGKVAGTLGQIIQIAMTRFQRVTYMTLHRYFGLTSELLRTEGEHARQEEHGQDITEEDLGHLVSQTVARVVGIDDILELGDQVTQAYFKAGEIIVAKDEIGEVNVVLEGEIEVCVYDLDGRVQSQRTIKRGDFAGHWSFVTGCPSIMEIKAKTSCRVAVLSKRSLELVLEKNPKLWAKVSKMMLSQLSPMIRQIDFALQWIQIDAGEILYRQGDESPDINLVLNGRLRANIMRGSTQESEFYAEYTPGDAAGDIETITQTPRLTTVHAVRDTEIARISRQLFNFLAFRYPQAMIYVSRIIASKSQAAMISGSKNNFHQHKVKTVAILPVSTSQPIPLDLCVQHLLFDLSQIGSCTVIDGVSILQQLGKNALNSLGNLKLTSWLEEQERNHRIVIFKADRLGTPWMQKCVRQADLIMLLAVSQEEATEGDVEAFLRETKNTVRKELVLLHDSANLVPGTTYRWLQHRPWIQLHHHVLLPVGHGMRRQNTMQSIREPQMDKFVWNRDFSRLARHLTKRTVAVVLGGGGARGMAHIGFLKAMEEAGIPIDMLGGTSMGAFIGGLYARDVDTVSILGWALKFSTKMSSKIAMAWDLTYPVAAWFSGVAFNRQLKKTFSDQQIEDLWLSYFCTTTNISKSRLEVHRNGTLWRYCRASMSLSGFLPPLCDQGDMLVDGGYLNNLPADVMKSMSGAKRIIAVDVAISEELDPIDYGDHLSGWWVLLNSKNPFANRVKYPTIAEIQSQLAYVSCTKQLQEVKKLEGVIYLQPPIHKYEMMGFHKASEIVEVGYKYGKEVIEKWRTEGVFSEFLDPKPEPAFPTMKRRRYSH